jgi:hypothetical protein
MNCIKKTIKLWSITIVLLGVTGCGNKNSDGTSTTAVQTPGVNGGNPQASPFNQNFSNYEVKVCGSLHQESDAFYLDIKGKRYFLSAKDDAAQKSLERISPNYSNSQYSCVYTDKNLIHNDEIEIKQISYNMNLQYAYSYNYSNIYYYNSSSNYSNNYNTYYNTYYSRRPNIVANDWGGNFRWGFSFQSGTN